jgi:hypothetical protein
MYDTLNLYLSAIDVGDTPLMETIRLSYLEHPKGILDPETGAIVCYCGALGNLKISVSNMGYQSKMVVSANGFWVITYKLWGGEIPKKLLKSYQILCICL